MDQTQIHKIISSALADHVFPGCVFGYIDHDQTIILPAGRLRYQENQAVAQDTIYDIASITKSLVTTTLALQLIDSGQLSLDDLVQAYIPEFKNPFTDKITIRHLVLFTLDFDLQLATLKTKTADQIWDKIFSVSLVQPPGSNFGYINTTSMLLGLVLERITGESVSVLAEKLIFSPLGMKDTIFAIPDFVGALRRQRGKVHNVLNIAPTEIDDWRGREVCGEIHDESAWVMAQAGQAVGSAGVFSTVPDLVKFLGCMLDLPSSLLPRKNLFSDMMAEHLVQDQSPDLPGPVGLGWEMDAAWMNFGDKPTGYSGDYSDSSKNYHLIGKTGFTGCCLVLDLPHHWGMVLLSNATYPKRPATKAAINRVRQKLVAACRI